MEHITEHEHKKQNRSRSRHKKEQNRHQRIEERQCGPKEDGEERLTAVIPSQAMADQNRCVGVRTYG